MAERPCPCLHKVALHEGHCCLAEWPEVVCHDEAWQARKEVATWTL